MCLCCDNLLPTPLPLLLLLLLSLLVEIDSLCERKSRFLILTNLTSVQLTQYIYFFYTWATTSNAFVMVNELDFIKFTNHIRYPKKNYIGFIHPFHSSVPFSRRIDEKLYGILVSFIEQPQSLSKRMESWIFFQIMLKIWNKTNVCRCHNDWMTMWAEMNESVECMQFILLCYLSLF